MSDAKKDVFIWMADGRTDGRTAMLQYGCVRIHVVGVLRKPCPAKKRKRRFTGRTELGNDSVLLVGEKDTHREKKYKLEKNCSRFIINRGYPLTLTPMPNAINVKFGIEETPEGRGNQHESAMPTLKCRKTLIADGYKRIPKKQQEQKRAQKANKTLYYITI